MVIHLNSIVSSRWIQQMNPHSFVIICLYPFLPSTSSCHPIIFWISLQKRVLLRRGGKGKINPWWPPHKKTKQTLPPSYPSFFISLFWFAHRIKCRFSVLWITFIVNFEVINLTFSFVNLEKLVTVPLVDSVIFWIWWMINWQEARFGRDGSNKSIRKKGIFCYKFHLKWLFFNKYPCSLLTGIFWWSLSNIPFSQIWW